MPAGATAIVMMVHHPISNFRFFSKNCAAYFYNNAAWLVAGDYWAINLIHSNGDPAIWRSVRAQVSSTHPRCFYL
jgi:hypothetical protein